jgi:heme/copper-type cytochrome/quinol oxidase subunit 2
MELIISFHSELMCYMIFISTFVFTMLFSAIYNFARTPSNLHRFSIEDNRLHFEYYKNITESVPLEVAWTVIPMVLNTLLLISSYTLLYSLDTLPPDNDIIIKIIGH